MTLKHFGLVVTAGVVAALLGAGTSSAVVGNRAPDPDFESDPVTSYYTNGPCGFSWTTDVSHSPTHSLKIVSAQPPSTLCRWMSRISAIPVLVTSEGFHVDAFLKTQGVNQGSANIVLSFWDSSQSYIPGSATSSPLSLSGTQDWTDVSVFARAPAGAKYVRVEFRMSGPGALWADDLSLLGDSLLVANLSPPVLVNTTASSRLPGFLNFAGDTLTASSGVWTGNPSSFLFEFDRCNSSGCAPVPNQGGDPHTPQYTTTRDDIGSTIGVTVFANSLDSSGHAASNRLFIDPRNPGCFLSDFCTVQLAPDIGFENDPSPFFYTNGPCAFSWTTVQSHSSSHSLMIVSTTSTLCRWMTNITAIPAAPDSGIPGTSFTTNFTVSAYMKTQGVSGVAELVVTYWTANQTYIAGSARTGTATLTGTRDWTNISLDANHPPPGSAFMRAEVRLTGSGTLAIDDLSISRETFVGA